MTTSLGHTTVAKADQDRFVTAAPRPSTAWVIVACPTWIGFEWFADIINRRCFFYQSLIGSIRSSNFHFLSCQYFTRHRTHAYMRVQVSPSDMKKNMLVDSNTKSR